MREEGWQAYLACVEELLRAPQVQAMREIRHHPGVSCYEHSVFVSYTAFRLAERVGHAVEQLAGLLILLCSGCLPHAKSNKQAKYFVQHSFL